LVDIVLRELAGVPDLLSLQRVDRARYPLLLESVAGGNALSRWDLLLAADGNGLRLDADGTTRRLDGMSVDGDFLSALDRDWLAARSDGDALELPFRGGWALYLGYELAAQIEWNLSLGNDAIEIDPHLLQEAFVEILRNANTHDRGEGAFVFEVRREGGSVEFRLTEPKTNLEGTTEDWGGRPLERVRSGHYGLGLFRARGIFEAHHGKYRVHFDPAASVLETIVTLPCSGGQ